MIQSGEPLDNQISARLIDLNIQFYQTFASSFSVSRYTVQPGVRKIINEYLLKKTEASDYPILDLGCGNGVLAHYLDQNLFRGKYLGVDGSSNLLELGAKKTFSAHFSPNFLVLEITSSNWETHLPGLKYYPIVSFAVLHHIPGINLRLDIFRKINMLLPPGGLFIHSNWQFLNSPKLSGRIVPWEKIGLSTLQVDPGDALLDWRAEDGKTGYRYVHHFSEEEMKKDAFQAGFHIVDSFYSDGRNGNLALYQVWQTVK
jgi:tRNA (uracil-5-)-methyltransferase TRM9